MLTPRRFILPLILSAVAMAGSAPAMAQSGATLLENATVVDAGLGTTPSTLKWGLLHGFTDCAASGGVDCTDPTTLIDALAPETWRLANFWNGTHRYVINEADFPGRLGTLVYWVVQDSFNLWLNGGTFSPYPFCVGPPDCVPNSNHVFATFAELRDTWRAFLIESAPARPAIDWYEVFSEPDVTFIGVTPAQIGELLVMTHDLIRSVEPDAKIAAPSMSVYNRATLGGLLGLIRQTGIQLDAISWHEFGKPEAMVAHAADLRGMCYPDCPPFHVTEYQGKQANQIPGEQVAWLAALERAGVALAHKACWNTPLGDPSGPMVNTCWAGFDGLLGPDNQSPQPGYFVHVAYQALESLRLQADVQNPDAEVIASISPNEDKVSLLVGARAVAADSNETITLFIPSWSANTSAAVEMKRVENPGNVLLQGSYQPITSTSTVTVSQGQVVLPAFSLLPGEAWSITVTPTAPVTSPTTAVDSSGPLQSVRRWWRRR